MLVRVKQFGVAHADLFSATTTGGGLFAAVGATVDKLTAYGVAQTRGIVRDQRSTKTAARDALRTMLARIRRTANAITPEPPAMNGKFIVPRSRGDQRLLLAARGFLQDATPLRDQLVAHHLSATFLDDLSAAIDAFAAAIQAQADLRESLAAARAGIADTMDAGSAAVDRRDAIVPNALQHQPDILAEWQSARHISQVSIPYPSRKHPSGPPPAPAPATGLMPLPAVGKAAA